MWSIKYVLYKVLINGQPHRQLISKIGHRQTEQVSPYLFIIFTEVLIVNIWKAEKDFKIARASPSVSHIFFVDDSLFFCKSKNSNVKSS